MKILARYFLLLLLSLNAGLFNVGVAQTPSTSTVSAITGVHAMPFAQLISGADLDPVNRYIFVNFDPDVYHSSGGALLASDLQVTFSQNGGVATACSISSITTTTGTSLVGGENTVRINLSFTGNPSGVESIEIKPSFVGSYRDSNGNLCSPIDGTGQITLQITLDDFYKNVIIAEIGASESIPVREQREAENSWFVTGRTAGWLTELDRIHFASFDQNHVLYNFVSGTKTATLVGTPVLTKYLGQRGAASSYIDFNWNPSTNAVKHLQNDRSFIVHITNSAQSAGMVFGARGTSGGVNFGHTRLLPRNTSDQSAISTGINNGGNELVVSSVTSSIHTYHGSRNAASGTNAVQLYIDGTLAGSDVDASSTPTERDYYGNTENLDNGTPTINISHDCLLWAWGSNLRTHAASIATASSTLANSLAAQIPSIVADKLYSLAGQSLMDRCGLVSELTAPQIATYVTDGPYLIANGYDANCYVWWDDEWQPLEVGVNGVDKNSGGTWFGPIYPFALAEAAKYPGEDLYFIIQAVGGTAMLTSSGLNNWLPGGVFSSMYTTYKRKYDNAISQLNSVTQYMPFYWDQSYSDATDDVSSDANSAAYGPINIAGRTLFSNSSTLSAVNGQTSLTTSAAHGVSVGNWVGIKEQWYRAVTGTTGTTLVLERAYEGVTETVANADLDKTTSTGGTNREGTMMTQVLSDTQHDNFIVVQMHALALDINYEFKSRLRAQKEQRFLNGNYGIDGALINIDDLTFRDNPHLTNTEGIIYGQRLSAAFP